MDYSSIYFGRPLGQLTYDDIELFFSNPREETDQLEFKSFNANGKLEDKLTGLTQGITAFLNSSGGVLVWGAPEGKPNPIAGKKEKIFTGNLTPLPLSIEKDWLISKVSDRIIPLPSGIRAQLVSKGDSQVCVFEIDESSYSPHQTEGTYYMRIDGQKKPAPHHYVEALFRKISFPQIEGYLKPYDLQKLGGHYSMKVEFSFINYSPYENEEDFHYKIWLVGGAFTKETTFQNPSRNLTVPLPSYEEKGSKYKSDSVSILHYGEPEQHTESILFLPDTIAELPETGGNGHIVVFFGGKKSPMKMSRYVISFSKWKEGVINEPSSICSIAFENKLLSDLNPENAHFRQHQLQALGVLRSTQ